MKPCEKMFYTDTDIAATKAALNAIYGTSPVVMISNNECDITPIMPKIERVIYNNPATVVYWSDGSKTVVKCQDGPRYKALGNSMAVPVVRWIGERIRTVLLGIPGRRF